MKNILITGANGLIARIVAKQLNRVGYQLHGVDIDPEGTPSSRFKRESQTDSDLLRECPYKSYYQLDITQKYQVTEVINKIGKIDCVIHLAAISDNESVERIKAVNEGGAQALFAACLEHKIDNIILASSVMAVWGKLVDEKIHLLNNPPRIDATAIHLPKDILPPLLAYINSKIYLEKLSFSYYLAYQISSVCLRIGAVSCDDSSYEDASVNTIWCSHAQIAAFTQSAVEALTAKELPFFGVYYVCSANKDCWVELKPVDSAPPSPLPFQKLPGELQQEIKLFGRSSLKSKVNPDVARMSEATYGSYKAQ